VKERPAWMGSGKRPGLWAVAAREEPRIFFGIKGHVSTANIIVSGAVPTKTELCGIMCVVSFEKLIHTMRTKDSRQRRLVRGDLPLRTPRRGCGKTETHIRRGH
jgi:hypothetical protein